MQPGVSTELWIVASVGRPGRGCLGDVRVPDCDHLQHPVLVWDSSSSSRLESLGPGGPGRGSILGSFLAARNEIHIVWIAWHILSTITNCPMESNTEPLKESCCCSNEIIYFANCVALFIHHDCRVESNTMPQKDGCLFGQQPCQQGAVQFHYTVWPISSVMQEIPSNL